MARHVYLDRDGHLFTVAWYQGAQPRQSRSFAWRHEAEAFAEKKMGTCGMIVSTLDMTAEQLAELRAREARAAAIMKGR